MIDAALNAYEQRKKSGPPPASSEPQTRAAENIRLLLSSAAFIRDFTPPDYLIDGILQRRFIYSLTGKTGSGKTALLLHIAASVGLERAIGSIGVQRGRVLYLAGENPDDVRMRWIALAQQMDFDVDDIDVHFIAGTFKISEMKARIEQEVTALGGVQAVIVDTSAAYFEGDQENDNKQNGDHARMLRGLTTLAGGPCVIAACHPVKNAADDNLSPRGGGAYLNEMDGNLTAKKEGSVLELHWQGKFRGPDFAPISFLLRTVTHERLKDSKGRLIPTVVAGHLSDAAQAEMAASAKSRENELLAALRDHPASSYAELAKTLGWHLRKGEPNKMAVKRGLERLEKEKLVKHDRDEWTITDKAERLLAGK